jgi:steroid delta-isomerase-like uncharacterized protein
MLAESGLGRRGKCRYGRGRIVREEWLMAAAATEKLIRAYYDCFNRADWDGMVGLMAADVAHDVNQGGREVGREAFRRFLERMAAAYREEVVELIVLTEESGKRAAAEYLVSGNYLKTDEGLPPARGQVYRIAGGRPSSVLR